MATIVTYNGNKVLAIESATNDNPLKVKPDFTTYDSDTEAYTHYYNIVDVVCDYIRNNVSRSDISRAWGAIEQQRAPLGMVANELYHRIEELVAEAFDELNIGNEDDAWEWMEDHDPEQLFEEL